MVNYRNCSALINSQIYFTFSLFTRERDILNVVELIFHNVAHYVSKLNFIHQINDSIPSSIHKFRFHIFYHLSSSYLIHDPKKLVQVLFIIPVTRFFPS